MFGSKKLRVDVLGMVTILTIAALLGGCCCSSNRCGNPCGKSCSWPGGSLEMGFYPTKGCNQGCYDPCYPYSRSMSTSKVSSSPSTEYEDSGYLSDAEAGGSGTSNY